MKTTLNHNVLSGGMIVLLHQAEIQAAAEEHVECLQYLLEGGIF